MFEAIFGFFALWSIGFWSLVAVASIIFIVGAESDKYTFSGIVTAVLALLYWRPLMAVGLSWQIIVGIVVGYCLAGVAWSVFRWWKYVEAVVIQFKKESGGQLSDTEKSSVKYQVSVNRNKRRILGWIAYWPWSVIWNITGDVFTMLYNHMKAAYQRIADAALAKLGVS